MIRYESENVPIFTVASNPKDVAKHTAVILRAITLSPTLRNVYSPPPPHFCPHPPTLMSGLVYAFSMPTARRGML